MNAKNDYVIRMTKEELPPANGFWSITLYDQDNGFFIPNDRKKYSVGENSGMKLNEDGGIEIYVAAEKPKGVPTENWLPINRMDQNIDLGGTTTGTGVDITIGAASNAIDKVVECGQVLDEQNIPETGRWMVIPAWVAGLIKQSDLKDASLSGDGTSILRNGRLGMIDRFTLYISNVLTADTVYTSSFPVLFGTKAGFSFASQVTKMETIRSERTFSNLLRGLQVYGYKVVNGVALGTAWARRG